MKRIASFEVDHTKIDVGMYTSRVDGDITTYDVRMTKPNNGVYLSTGSMHTIEHIFATYARNHRLSDKIIYVGPMGCRTGFYILVRDMDPEDAISLVRESLQFISEFTGDIPGATEIECGNYKDQDLISARKDVKPLLNVLKDYKTEMLDYSWHYAQIV